MKFRYNFIRTLILALILLFNLSSRADNTTDSIPEPYIIHEGITGTLPVLYINVYQEDSEEFDNDVIDRNLDHKNYFSGEYWLDCMDCTWLKELGAKNLGSAENPLPLEIKARGNITRLAFSKKPYKLKLGSKQSMLGLSKSKHFALLAHADDSYGFMRNYVAFNLGKRIGLPWTPSQQPVEVVINNDYRGLYFLTESIRVDEKRVNIAELDDLETEPELISGGYIIELDNYTEENQIRIEEKSCSGHAGGTLLITWDTPEEYSSLQKLFITDQFNAMNDCIGANSDILWSYMDLDDAARYYLVTEIMSHVEAYHGSTYLFRDRGENQKWHFSPLWDFGQAFNGSMTEFFYECAPFGNNWIHSMRENDTFNQKVKDTWMWFMSNEYGGIENDIDDYVAHIRYAAIADHDRWGDEPYPDYEGSTYVRNNSDMDSKRDSVLKRLQQKTDWLKTQFGDYTLAVEALEPERDTTPAAELPDYANEDNYTEVEGIDFIPDENDDFFTLQGFRVSNPERGKIYIVVRGEKAIKILY